MSLQWFPNVLILSPCGILGFTQLGILLKLYNEDLFKDLKSIVGVSAGSIIAFLLSCGYKPIEIITESPSIELMIDFTNINFSEAKNNEKLIRNTNLRSTLETLVKKKLALVPTLEQLYNFSGIELIVVTFNFTKEQTEYISYRNEPNLSAVDAVLLSANISLPFYLMKYKNCIYLDGGISDPYPVDKYDDGKNKILGIYITTNKKVVDEDVISYLYKIINTNISISCKNKVHKSSNNCKHILIEYLDNFDNINAETKGILIMKGYNEACEFLERLKNEESEQLNKENKDDIEIYES